MNRKNNISEILNYWLGKIDPGDRSSVLKLWNNTDDETDQVKITEQEKRNALAHIKEELELTKQTSETGMDETSVSTTNALDWRWIAAAAIVLFAAGVSYLFIPTEVTVPHGQQKTITLSDNTRVVLNSGSTLSYNRLYGVTNRNTFLEGEAYFDVQPGENPFTVETFNSAVHVLGTKFNIRSWSSEPASETTVMLTEGQLAFHSLSEPANEVILNPGERSTLAEHSVAPTTPDKAAIEHTLAWMEHRFMFENRPLYQIIPELERRFDITIEVEAEQIMRDSLTIYYSSDVLAEDIIRDLCLSQGLTYRAINNGFVIEKR